MKPSAALSFAFALALTGPVRTASAVAIGIADTFEDGTTQGWVVAIGPMGAAHPVPPVNVATGGPEGADDNYLQLGAVGGIGAGSRLTAINATQWAGDYTALGVTSISMDVRNLGTSDLALRLFLEDPLPGPPTNTAVTDAVIVPSGADWTHVSFSVRPLDLVALMGSVDTLLGNVTVLRLFHGPDPLFPGPDIVTQLGVDNIVANGALAAPEPGTALLLVAAILALEIGRRRRLQR
jgi:hypothetical protein